MHEAQGVGLAVRSVGVSRALNVPWQRPRRSREAPVGTVATAVVDSSFPLEELPCMALLALAGTDLKVCTPQELVLRIALHGY